MSMNQSVGIVMGGWGILINILLYVSIYMGYWNKKHDKVPQALLYLILVNILLQSADTCFWVYRGNVTTFGFFMTSLANYIYFICITLLALCFSNYIDCLIQWCEVPVRPIYTKLVMLIGMVLNLLVTLNIKTKWFFYMDEQNMYVRTNAFILISVLQILMIGIIIWGMIRYMESSAAPFIGIHFSIFFFFVPISFYQMFTYKVSILGLGFTVGVFTLYSIHLRFQSQALERQARQMEEQEQALRVQEHILQIQEEKLEETKEELVQTRIQVLIAQIKPHFIYNTMAMIRNCCYSAPEEAAELIGEFAKFLRASVSSLNTLECISLKDELDMVRSYMYLQQKRFGENLEYTEDIEAEDISLPALTVQIFVENAVRHGIGTNENGGRVHVHVFRTAEEYWITVKDNGVGYDTSVKVDEKQHVGMMNVRERLKKMCNGSIDIMSESGKGTIATIRIPIPSQNELIISQ